MAKYKKIAFIFPGQGAQFPGMGKDFIETFSVSRLTFEEGDELLGRNLSKIILAGPDTLLTQTNNSQPGIYVTSVAIFRVIQELFSLQPFVCAGLSLGEYTALTAGEFLPFMECLPLIQYRADAMSEACKRKNGSMAAIIGLDAEQVDAVIKKVNLPNDLWVANYNCPGQVVISGTAKGIEAGAAQAKECGAKKIIILPVQGAFHSGLMLHAEELLARPVEAVSLRSGKAKLVMNVTGDFVSDVQLMKTCLVKQVTSSVRWEQGVRAMDREGVDLFIEIGPGKSLSGMNKRIGPTAMTISIDSVADLDKLGKELSM
jgi:[acyl-carrier-protein] S-malonyltransferase